MPKKVQGWLQVSDTLKSLSKDCRHVMHVDLLIPDERPVRRFLPQGVKKAPGLSAPFEATLFLSSEHVHYWQLVVVGNASSLIHGR